MAVAEQIDGKEGGMLGYGDDPLAKSPYLTINILKAVGSFFFYSCAGKKVVNFLKKQNVS